MHMEKPTLRSTKTALRETGQHPMYLSERTRREVDKWIAGLDEGVRTRIWARARELDAAT